VTPLPAQSFLSPSPRESLGDDDIVEVLADGTVWIVSPDGSRRPGSPDLFAPRGPFTGVDGALVGSDGFPISGAAVRAVTDSGLPCSGLDIGHVTGPRGNFRLSLPPGKCWISALVRGSETARVPALIEQDRTTQITIHFP
jgi:hypothetical protein